MNFIQDLRRSLEVLKNGGVILYPTDTIWGLGCDATNPVSLQKINQIKYRNTDNKSFIILVDDVSMLERYVKTIPETASSLISVSTSPLTIIYPEGINLADGICNNDGSVGIRICHDIFCRELISQFRKPIVSTSANITGQPAPSKFSEIDKEIIKSVDYTVEYRQNDKQVLSASPIIKVDNNGVIKILRE